MDSRRPQGSDWWQRVPLWKALDDNQREGQLFPESRCFLRVFDPWPSAFPVCPWPPQFPGPSLGLPLPSVHSRNVWPKGPGGCLGGSWQWRPGPAYCPVSPSSATLVLPAACSVLPRIWCPLTPSPLQSHPTRAAWVNTDVSSGPFAFGVPRPPAVDTRCLWLDTLPHGRGRPRGSGTGLRLNPAWASWPRAGSGSPGLLASSPAV